MAWTEEISEAAYTSPSGKRIVFNYEPSVEKSTSLKTSESVFPDLDGAEIQSLGLGGKKFPMIAIFSGENCIKEADEFEELLCERGYGELEHPIYGKHVVVPTGEIGRSDNLVSGANESRVKITSDNVKLTHEDGGQTLSVDVGARMVLIPGNIFAEVSEIVKKKNNDVVTFKAVPFEPTEAERKAYVCGWYDK